MTSDSFDYRATIDEMMPGVIADRRHLHQHPELAFQEFETAAFIAERLDALGLEDIKTGVGKTGVTGLIRGTGTSGSGKVLMLRADMDALPILEENEVDYVSQNPGVMHACGHDSHVSMLLGTTKVLMDRRGDFDGTVKILFQPAEEGGGGATAMRADGALEHPTVDAAMGLHIWQDVPCGDVWVRPGTAMVGVTGFTITVYGTGGHGARPAKCIDPIVVGSSIVSAALTLVSRERDPITPEVVSFGSFKAGNAFNVIPDTAVLLGTIRSVTKAQGEAVKQRLQALAEGVASSMGARVEFEFGGAAPPLINDPEIAEIVRAATTEAFGPERVSEGNLMSVSEDFGEFLDPVPGCYFFVGSRNEDKGFVYGHHHPKFDIDEEAMATGIEAMARSAIRYLQN
ncbi:MAG: M20 family metallopeptidase [Thermomicrobiales bacterium]|nr:M20 family metallopeptidase [Thermomicrobiales bacterium]